MKSFIRALLRFLLIGLFQLFGILPLPLMSALAAALMTFISWFLKRYRRIAAENLRHAYPGITPREIARIITAGFRSIGLTIAEMLCFGHRPEAMMKRISVDGLEHLDRALANGKGVVAVTAHLGNFPLMMSYLAWRGYSVSVIFKPPRDQKADDYFISRWKTITGARIIYSMPRLRCIQESLKVLRGNGLLFILPDQNFGDDGSVFVDFFGRTAATGTGPSVFARRSGACIVPMFIVRQPDATHKIIIEKPVEAAQAPTEEEALIVQTQQLAAVIEQYLRRCPDQWLWFHKRWKTSPEDQRAKQGENHGD